MPELKFELRPTDSRTCDFNLSDSDVSHSEIQSRKLRGELTPLSKFYQGPIEHFILLKPRVRNSTLRPSLHEEISLNHMEILRLET